MTNMTTAMAKKLRIVLSLIAPAYVLQSESALGVVEHSLDTSALHLAL